MIRLEPDFPDDWTEVSVTPPATPKKIAGALGIKPFQVIADLMTLRIFGSVNTDLSEDAEALAALSKKYRVRFVVAP